MENRSKMLDSMGRPYTQALFLEIGYEEDVAVYTLKEVDYVYNGRTYPSIKQLYLASEDPTEYEFANQYFMGWKHWQRICENKSLRKHIDEWRDELEIKLKSKAVKNMLKSAEDGNYQASKWLADRGWHTRPAGRPTKAEVERERKIAAAVGDEYSADVVRLFQEK